MYKQHTY